MNIPYTIHYSQQIQYCTFTPNIAVQDEAQEDYTLEIILINFKRF